MRGVRAKCASEGVETGGRIGGSVVNQQLAVDVETAVVGLPDDGDSMPLTFAKRCGYAAGEGGKAAAMETQLVVFDIDGDFVEAVGQAVAVGLHQIEEACIPVRARIGERERIEVGANHEFDGSFRRLRAKQINAGGEGDIAFVYDLQCFAVTIGDAFRVDGNADEAVAGIIEQIGQVGIETVVEAKILLR